MAIEALTPSGVAQISSEAFSTLLANPLFAEFALTLSKRLVSEITLKVLSFSKGRTFGEFAVS